MKPVTVSPLRSLPRHIYRPNLQSSPLRLHQSRRFNSSSTSSPYASRRRQHFYRAVAVVAFASTLTTFYTWYSISDAHAEVPLFRPSKATPEPEMEIPDPTVGKPLRPDLKYEEAKQRAEDVTKNQNRDQISSQHLQVKKSWENPGVWAWGANDGKVAVPGSKEASVRNPRWLAFFDGMLLRDMKLASDSGAAITENGDLLQWGSAFYGDGKRPGDPLPTLTGKDLISISMSRDCILALSSSGTVYNLSISRADQQNGPKPLEHYSSWLPFWSSRSSICYRKINPGPALLGWTEKVTSISSGLEHALLLTSSGRVFSAASCNTEYPSRGQLGIPGLTWFNRPNGPYDQPHEVVSLHGFKIRQVATGDYHSVALDEKGRVFSWGENEKGQLGLGDTSKAGTWYDAPSLLPITKLYAGSSQKPHVRAIAAGGNTTFLTVDAERVAVPTDATDLDDNPNTAAAAQRRLGIGKISSDVWASGHGIWGQLGTGRWTHVQALPTRIQPLSGLFEYDEAARRAIPIRMRALSIGSNHCAATMDNVTYTDAHEGSSDNDTNWGADVLFFGNNEYFQLGTGKRNNVANPTYIRPMDREAEIVEGMRPKDEGHRFHITPWSTVYVKGNKEKGTKGRWVAFEQRVVCGRGVTAVYSGV